MLKVLMALLILLLSGCGITEQAGVSEAAASQAVTEARPVETQTAGETPAVEPMPISLINPDGMSLSERFSPPEGFSRIQSEQGSFAEFLQALPLKPDGSKVKYYDGREKTRDVYLAVVDYPLGERDLQQCADAVMRLRAEYLYASNQADSISFNFVNGFAADFSKWSAGYGISVDGSNVSWVRSGNDGSYESFQKYLDMVYAYSSTLSLEKELISKESIEIGDVFIVGGSPGHCVIVVDMAENDHEQVFMLAQSYMPAQDIQILKGGEEGSPWYSADVEDKLITPEWVFDKTQLKTWQ